jgi:glycosyltransferase involved in cell wall biosynthesis
MKNLSIIVPVYKVEKYLRQCIESILGQTYKDFELILVDDGSPDKSGEICDEYAKQDDRIKVIHKQNGGLMSAWKSGVEIATGNYIGFIDSDDWIDSNMFEKLSTVATQNNADLVVCNFIHEKENAYKQESFLREGFYSEKDIKEEIYPIFIRKDSYLQRGLAPSRWVKLYRKEILRNVLSYCDEKVSIGEDLLTTFAVIPFVKSLVVLGDFYPYHYREDNNSMIRSFSDDKYQKLENLKKAMLKTSQLYDYDFLEQIHGDYIALLFQQIEQEILISNRTFLQLKRSVKARTESPSFLESLQYVDKKRLTFKLKLYLFLIKNKMISAMILLRKLKK